MIQVELKGQPSNIGASQSFESDKDYKKWLNHIKENNLLPNLKVTASKLTFDGGSGTVK